MVRLFLRKLFKQVTSLSPAPALVQSPIPGGIFFTHSVKSPLTTLKLCLSELNESLAPMKNTAANDYLKTAQVATTQIEALVENIKNESQVIVGPKIRVREILEKLKVFYHTGDRSYQVVFNISVGGGQEKLKLNKLYFLEMMGCLINNGLEAYDRYSRNKVVIVTAVTRKKRLEIQVQDFGSGAPKKSLRQMVKNGFTTKATGHGFGLWFVKRIVETYCHSRLQIFSQAGQGTIVRFSLGVS